MVMCCDLSRFFFSQTLIFSNPTFVILILQLSSPAPTRTWPSTTAGERRPAAPGPTTPTPGFTFSTCHRPRRADPVCPPGGPVPGGKGADPGKGGKGDGKGFGYDPNMGGKGKCWILKQSLLKLARQPGKQIALDICFIVVGM